jgi:hypothetical protein
MSFLERLNNVVTKAINLYENAVLKPNFKKLAFSYLATGIILSSIGFTNLANAGLIGDHIKGMTDALCAITGQQQTTPPTATNKETNAYLGFSTVSVSQEPVEEISTPKVENPNIEATKPIKIETKSIPLPKLVEKKIEPKPELTLIRGKKNPNFTKAGEKAENTLAYASAKQDNLMALSLLLYYENLKAVKAGNVTESYNIISSAITRTVLYNFHKKELQENQVFSLVDVIASKDYSFNFLTTSLNNPLVKHKNAKEKDFMIVNNQPDDLEAFKLCQQMVLSVLPTMTEHVRVIVHYASKGLVRFDKQGNLYATGNDVYGNTVSTNFKFINDLIKMNFKMVGTNKDDLIKVGIIPINAKDPTAQIHFKLDFSKIKEKKDSGSNDSGSNIENNINSMFERNVNYFINSINNNPLNKDIIKAFSQKNSI